MLVVGQEISELILLEHLIWVFLEFFLVVEMGRFRLDRGVVMC